ncbi:MAG: aldo/keto reductase [Cypionkella sp.]
MNITRLGRSGLEVSRVCFGCMSFGKSTDERPWVLGLDDARPMSRLAWEAGINFFDTTNVYTEASSEEITGQMIAEIAPRDQTVLETKVFGRTRPGGTSTKRATSDRYNKSMYDNVNGNAPAVVSVVEAVAKAHGVSMAQVAMAWLLQNSGVTAPIVGASKLSHVEQAVAAEALTLTLSEVAQLEAPHQPIHVAGF